MKRIILAMAIALATFGAGAAETSAPGAGVSAPAARAELSATQRQQILAEMQGRFVQAANARGKRGAEPNRKFARLVMEADSENLLAAAEMPTFETTLAALMGQSLGSPGMVQAVANAANGSPKFLGDLENDQVFTPLAGGRCRVADSRVINSLTTPAVVREIDVEDQPDYTAQGGSGNTTGQGSTICGIPSFATSFVASVTVLPVGSDGFFKIFETGKAFSEGNTVLYTGTVGASNDVIVRSCKSCINELSIYSNQQTHYVIDIIGYFMAPVATTPDCLITNAVTNVVAAGGQSNTVAESCPATYALMSTNCQSTSWTMPMVFQSAGVCSAQNNGAAPASLTATRTCCRIPGR